MKYKGLHHLRVLIACIMFLGAASFFLDFDGKIPESFAWIEQLQFACAYAYMPKFCQRLFSTGAFVASVGVIIWCVTFLTTLIFGRIYCSVICPLGIFQDIIAFIAGKSRQLYARFNKDPKTGKAKIVKNWKNYKYRKNHKFIRAAFFLFALITNMLGFLVWGLIEPYSIFGRIAVNVLRPIYEVVNNCLYALFKVVGPESLAYSFYYVDVRPESLGALLVGIGSFVLIVLFAGKAGRLYCNLICPVGTFLGLFSRYALFKTYIKQDKCIGCGMCAKACKSSCIDVQNKTVDNSRCVVCFDCFNSCRKDAIAFGIKGSKNKLTPNEVLSDADKKLDPETLKEKQALQREAQNFDRSKRNFITLSALTLAAVAAKTVAAADKKQIFIGDAADNDESVPNNAASADSAPASTDTTAGGALGEDGQVQYTGYKPLDRKHTISPPGSKAHGHMMHHCISCHLCVAKCPSHVLKPSGFENGLRGFLQPRMDFTHGFCNFDCTTCGDVCPTPAILPLTMEKKHVTQVGHVVFVKENCIVPVLDQHCGACSEHCPTQAVHMVPYGDHGLTIPETNVDLCVGCGGCEYICPARPHRAIYVEGNVKHVEATPPPKEETKHVEEVDFGF